MIFIALAFLTLSFTLRLNAVENNEDIYDKLFDRKNLMASPKKQLPETSIGMSEYFINCITFCFPCFFRSNTFYHQSNEEISLLINKRNKIDKLALCREVIILIAEFLDFCTQLKFSHVNTDLKKIINDNFWEKQIIKLEYLLWNPSLPRAKIFFANYFYQKGFGRHPMLPERVDQRIEDVDFIPNAKLAKKALILGFPKGEKSYRKIQHKEFLSSSKNNKFFILTENYDQPYFKISALSKIS